MAKGDKKVVEEKKVIKETKYCEVYKAVSIIDDDYYSSIEKIKVKSKNREEVRFALYKDTFKMERQFIPRSLDLTEKQLLELIRKAIEGKVYSGFSLLCFATVTTSGIISPAFLTTIVSPIEICFSLIKSSL